MKVLTWASIAYTVLSMPGNTAEAKRRNEMSIYRIQSSQKATVNGKKGRIVELYESNVHAGKFFVPASIRSNEAAIEYALNVRAEELDEFRGMQS